MSATGRSGRAVRASPARPPASFWAAAEAARREGLLSYGALEYLRALARLARARGDGRSFTVGERVIEEITGYPRRCCQRWRVQLERLGFLAFDRRWAHKRGWFWEAKTTLLWTDSTGDKMSPVNRRQNVASTTGDKMSPSLYRDQSTVKGSRQRAARASHTGGGSRLRPASRSEARTAPTASTPPASTEDGKTTPPAPQPDWEHLADTWRRLTAKLRDVPPPDDPAACP